MTSKLKTGDNVRLNKRLKVGHCYGTYGGIEFLDTMREEFENKKARKVISTTPHGTARLFNSRYTFDVKMLVKI